MTAAETAVAMGAALAKGQTSAADITKSALDDIRSHRGWNAFILVDEAGAIDAAAASDLRRRQQRSLGPLDGIPIAIKDNVDAAGLPTTVGIAAYRGRIAAADATVTARLRASGCVILGKLNLHEGALGATTDNAAFGRCENPRFPGHTPGGSSGGSGAAVAGRLVPIAIGTDTMGSVRIPAAYCGVWGLKPTRGLISNAGLSYLSWTLDTIGPLARSADDLDLALAAMAGPDPADPFSQPPPADWDIAPEVSLRGAVFGHPTAVDTVDCEPEVRDAYEALLDRLLEAGAEIRMIDIARWDTGKVRRSGLLISEAEAGSLVGADVDGDPAAFGREFRQLIDFGRKAPAERLATAYWDLAHLGHKVRRALGGLDALVMPTAPQRPFRHGAAVPANQADFTALANVSGCPAVAFPLPGRKTEAPLSAQLIGPLYSERRLLRLARAAAML